MTHKDNRGFWKIFGRKVSLKTSELLNGKSNLKGIEQYIRNGSSGNEGQYGNSLVL
jgi:hypothetical protein